MYALVKYGQVVDEVAILPSSWANISGLNLLPKEELKQLGWLPVEVVNEAFDTELYEQGFPAYEILEDKVVKTYPLTEISYEKRLQREKEKQLDSVKAAFDRGFQLGYYCPSVGIKMDCRRIDLTNMQSLYSYMKKKNTLVTFIRDYNNEFHQVGVEDIQNIVDDLIEFGMYMYQRKWQLQTMINGAETIEEVQSIHW